MWLCDYVVALGSSTQHHQEGSVNFNKGNGMQLAILNTNETITTLQLLEMINSARTTAGEPVIENSKFIAKVEDELDDISTDDKKSTVINRNNQAFYTLTIEQATLVGMRESKAVRRGVIAVLKAMSRPEEPQTKLEWMRVAVAAEEAKEAALALAHHAISTKAEIGERREATAMNTASQAVKRANKLEIELDISRQYSTIKRMEMLHHGIKFNWRLLKSAGTDLGIESKEVFDANYGSLKAYHADVWMEAYALSIEQ